MFHPTPNVLMGTSVHSMKSGRSRFDVKHKRQFKSPLDKAHAREVIWPQVAPVFNAARGITDCRFVYLIGEEDEGAVKIGFAKDPVGRLRTMQTGNPRRLRIEYVLIGDMPLEKLLHEIWEEYAIPSARRKGKFDAAPGTEWFRSEVRKLLCPIVATAAEHQVDYVCDRDTYPIVDGVRAEEPLVDELTFDELEDIVRRAHTEHDFIPTRRDEVLLLGRAAGYARVGRRGRI